MSLKIFFKSAVIYSIGTAGLRFSAFLLIPIYTHFLSLKDFGLLATLLLTIQFMVTIIDFGVRETLMRFIPDYNRENRAKYLLGSLISINFINGIIVLIISTIFLESLFKSVLHEDEVHPYIFLSCIAALTQSISVNIISYFRASNEGMKYMIINLLTAVFIFISTYIFFKIFNIGVSGAILAQIVSYFIPGAIVLIYIWFKVGLDFSFNDIKAILKYCTPLILATAGFSINSTTSTYLLSYFTNLEKVGIYSLALRISQIASILIVLPFQLAYEPYVYSNIENKDIKNIISRLTTYMLLTFALVGFLIVFVFRDLIHVIAPKEYFQAYNYIFLLLPAMAFSGLFYVGQSLLHINKKTKITGYTVLLISTISIFFSYFLIKYFGISGVVISYNIYWILVSLSVLKLGLKEFPVIFEFKRLITIAIIFALLLLVTFLLYSSYSLLFYITIPLLAILVFVMLYFNFLHVREKIVIKNFLRLT